MDESKNKPSKYSIKLFIRIKTINIDEGTINIF
jgi:hypothetical protein